MTDFEKHEPQQPAPPQQLPPGYVMQPQMVYVQQALPGESNTGPITALILGISGATVAWIPFLGIVAWVIGPLAILFGILGLRRPNQKTEQKIFAWTGIGGGVIALAFCVWYVVTMIVIMNSWNDPIHIDPSTGQLTN